MLLVSRGGTHFQVPPSGGAARGEDRVVANQIKILFQNVGIAFCEKLFCRMLLVSRDRTHVHVPPSGGAAGGEDRVVASQLQLCGK